MDFPSADTLFLKREFELCKSEFIAKSDKLFLNCLCHRNSLILTIHPYIIFLLACCVYVPVQEPSRSLSGLAGYHRMFS